MIVPQTLDEMFPLDGLQDPDFVGLQIQVMGQYEVSHYVPNNDEFCISIVANAHGGFLPPEAKMSGMFMEILRLRFDDLANDGFIYGVHGEGISPKQADLVADFVLKNKHRKKLVIHCFAGVNRSRSMAAAIVDVLELPYKFNVGNDQVYNAVYKAFTKKV